MTLIADREPQALAEQLGERVYVLIPPKEGDDPARVALAGTREIAKAIAPYSVAAFSSFCSQPRFFHRAIQEAELVLDVLLQEEGDRPAARRSTPTPTACLCARSPRTPTR